MKTCPKQANAPITAETCSRIQAMELCKRECEKKEKKDAPVDRQVRLPGV